MSRTCPKGQLEPRPHAWFLETTVPTKPPIPEERLVAIVDDDASVRQSARRLIRSLGYRAEAFGSAEEFLDSGQVTETACLVLDVRMPGMDGLGLQRHLADNGLPIPIVFFTARASDEEERRALGAGAVAFLRKPVDKEALLRALDAVLESSPSDGGNRDDD
jgi:FixJ family two-component response regulator